MSDEPVRYYACSHIGLAGTTPVTIKQTPGGFEARMGVAIFGHCNMNEEDFERAQFNPFHEEFHDNYVSGQGATEEEAIEALKKDLHEMHESLWSEP
jgi:hypothetical protein